MAFKPANSGNGGGGNGDFEYNLPTPKDGSRKARVSLIVDLGIQNREDFEDPKTKEVKVQKPAHQVAVFADLVNDVVDYGGKIGEQQYRLPLNHVFKGVMEGINFYTSSPTDADGNKIKGPWRIHPRNALSILAKAIGKEEIAIEGKHKESLDISLLLDQPFMCQVEVKKTPHKENKTDKDGKLIVYTNVNYKGAAAVPMVEDEDGEEKPLPVAKLRQPARCIQFDTATVEDIQFIRPSLVKKIKTANNYAGSAMQKAIEAYEAQQGDDGDSDAGDEPAPKEEAPKAASKPKAQPKPRTAAAKAQDAELEEDAPF